MVVDTLVESVGPFLVSVALFFGGVFFYVLLWLLQRQGDEP